MAFNAFEGARRIGTVLRGGVLLIGGAAFLLGSGDRKTLTFETSGAEAPFRLSETECSFDDQTRTIYGHTFANGMKADVELCFRAVPSTNGSSIIVTTADGQGYAGWTNEASLYMDQREKGFSLLPEEEAQARSFVHSEWWKERRSWLGTVVAFTAMAFGLLLAVQFLIGWIVRGFLSIPRGQDRREA